MIYVLCLILSDRIYVGFAPKCWELLAETFDRFQTLCNNTQQQPTTCNRVFKRSQHVTSNNVGSCWPTMLRPFARGIQSTLKVLSQVRPFKSVCTPCWFIWFNDNCLLMSKYFFHGILTRRTGSKEQGYEECKTVQCLIYFI